MPRKLFDNIMNLLRDKRFLGKQIEGRTPILHGAEQPGGITLKREK